ncbi:MAG: glycoside hydrolase family 43 [Cyanobium sp. CACIAM 14]|nr:MAG: glycoside hydrolase family 43 [Cyanobium sp. CACIAM 14]
MASFPRPSWRRVAVLALAGAGVAIGARLIRPQLPPPNLASGNGRLEAVEIDVATRTAGRIAAITVQEGEPVVAGQIVARMDTAMLEAELREAQAEGRRAASAVETASSTVLQRAHEWQAARATLQERQADLLRVRKRYERVGQLVGSGALPSEELDNTSAALQAARAAVTHAQADVAAAGTAVASARSLVVASQRSVEAASARIERLQADIRDGMLRSPGRGRVQFRIAEPGEVLGAGGKVLSLLDLGDVHMTFFLPTAQAGRVRIGSEARLVLDAAPQYVIPARITYVADVAQFTPRTVETAAEREKLMFRVKARVDPEVIRTYEPLVKTGLPGVAWVRLDPAIPWPERLSVRLPP